MSLIRTLYFESKKVAELFSRVTEDERNAGTETSVTNFSPSDIKDMIDTHAQGGVGNLTFFSLSADQALGSSMADVLAGSFTPPSASALVGILLSQGTNAATGQRIDASLRRGTSDITPLFRTSQTQDGWNRQLFLDKPNSAAAQTYKLRASKTGTGTSQILAGTSMTIFTMPDSVEADLITADESVAQNTDFLSVTITPSSASAKIKLNMLVMVSGDIDIQLRRGTTGLVSVGVEPQLQTNVTAFPRNFEDWVGEPNTTNAVTYHVRKTNSGSQTIQKGSYLMAQEVA